MKQKLLITALSLSCILQTIYVPYALVGITQSLIWSLNKTLLSPSLDLMGYIFSYISVITLLIFILIDFKTLRKLIAIKSPKNYLKSGFLVLIGNILAIIVLFEVLLALLEYHCQIAYC